MTQTVPSKSTDNVTYQGTARSRVPQAALSQSTDGSYYPRMDNRRPRISSYSPLSRSSNPRTTYRQQRPKKTVKSIWVKKGSTVGSHAVLPQTVKKSAMINPKQTWRPKGNYLDSVNRDNGSYTLKQFEYGNPEEDLKDYAIIDSGCSGSMTGDKNSAFACLIFKEFKGVMWLLKMTLKIKMSYSYLRKVSLLMKIWQQRMKYPTGTEDGALMSTSKNINKLKERTVREPSELLHMDLVFGPVSVGECKWKKNQERIIAIAKDHQQNGVAERKNRISLKLHRTIEQGISCDDVEDLDDQQFIVHTAQPMHTEERTAAKEVPLSSAVLASHDELLKEPESLSRLKQLKSVLKRAKKNYFNSSTREQERMIGGTIIKNKARLVAQGYRQEEGVDYDEVFAPVARIEAIRLFLAFASFMGFIPPGFEDPAHPNKVYRVVKALYGLHQAPRAWYERLSTFLLKHGYRRGAIDKTLFIKKDRRDIMLVQVYVDDIIFGSTKSSMVKDFEDLMQKEFKMSSMGELTFFLGLQVKQSIGDASRPDIMFAVCLCARFQVTPKVSHLHAVKRIFRYLKHQPKLGLWYPKDSPFHLEAFSDSDYAGDNHDRRSTSGGCQYLGRRLVSWQCKKQTIVAISSTEAEYVAAASCCAQVLWMQNQLLDYGFNFMNTEIHIDNESTICIVRNPVFHSKTKHIQIRHHFIRDCYEQRLINVVKVHTDDNVADLLTKGFDLARFNFLVVTIGMINP
ncbi:putative ribonuclease H-like domain-containing protein [Tanacetum coccineum]